ncbi:BMC domain-containing protein [bacterium]|nr:BMC domain-containing protein [bacterium]
MSQPTSPACLGMAEWDQIGPGMAATDALLKAAPVKLEQAFTAPPGRWFVLVSGQPVEVEKAMAEGRAHAAVALRDAAVLPDVHPELLRAMMRAQVCTDEEALGVLEADSLVAGVCAADAAGKAAPVLLLQVRLVGDLGGKSLVLFAGAKAEVEKALAAARDETDGRAATVSAVVIANVHDALRPLVVANT